MSKIKDECNKSCSSNLLFLRENNFQKDYVNIWLQKLTLNFENALFLLAHCKILVTFWKKLVCRVDQWSKLVFRFNAQIFKTILKGIYKVKWSNHSISLTFLGLSLQTGTRDWDYRSWLKTDTIDWDYN